MQLLLLVCGNIASTSATVALSLACPNIFVVIVLLLLLMMCGCSGRLENAVLLATKQAAFIQNPAYSSVGSGPDIVTIGHNPYAPNMGLCRCSAARLAIGTSLVLLFMACFSSRFYDFYYFVSPSTSINSTAICKHINPT